MKQQVRSHVNKEVESNVQEDEKEKENTKNARTANGGSKEGQEDKQDGGGLATIQEVFSFAETRRTKIYIAIGCMAAVLSGICFPAMAWLFSSSFSELSAFPSSDDFLQQIRQLVYRFLVLGVVMFVGMTTQATFLEAAACDMTQTLKRRWFHALIRQDMAYFDIMDTSGTATIIGSNGRKFQNGIGYKFANGIQFSVVCVGGLAYGFWSSWQIALLVLTVIPFMAVSTAILLKLNQTQSSRANETYSKAGAIVYSTVTSIRTILSLNAVETVVQEFEDATEHAYKGASSQMIWLGVANGSVMGSFLLAYFPLILYGSYLLYDNVMSTGCDPSGAVPDNVTCDPSAAGVFGALMGVTFGGATLPQVSASVEAFMGARAAAYPALVAISRKSTNPDDDDETKQKIDEKSEAMQRRGSASIVPLVLLPRYDIDSSSPFGIAPDTTRGRIRFKNVKFAYPTRPDVPILDRFSLDIHGTVAIVGKSGCGKSTILSLVERFYDVLEGTISLDGTDIRQLNVKWLRKQIGVVSQEPKLFSTTIKENIRLSCPSASDDEVEAAARKANAHDFVIKFPEGYDTQVGHEGTQMSGGQKQRIALARILIRQPKVIVLDEATSALDSESESIVQEALDKIIKEGHQTIIVIAHRLSTIKNADKIVVLESGKIVEKGKHDELMLKGGAYADLVKAQQGLLKKENAENDIQLRAPVNTSSDDTSYKSSSSLDELLPGLECEIHEDLEQKCDNNAVVSFQDVHFHYPTRPDAQIFKSLNLDVREGETLGICGPSGQGKSTIIQLLEAFYYPTKGTIKYLGVDTKDLNIKWMREQMSLVSQEPVLFDTTIEENIRFGMPHATYEQVEMAARQANAHDFIVSFPDGYQTDVGAGSTKISGGQKQRIAIARAIIRRPKLLLLDEATSNLDSESEQLVQNALDNIMSNSSQTTIIIAHRLSTIRRADRIAVINRGKVVEIGNHEELMALPRGKYKHLHELQDLGQSKQAGDMSSPPTPLLSKHSTVLLEDDAPTAASQVDADKENIQASKETKSKARMVSKGNEWYFAIGGFGAILAGLMFPGWGFVFAFMIETLYNPVSSCDEETGLVCIPLQEGEYCETVGDCEVYYNDRAEEIQDISFKVAYGLIGILVAALVGHALVWYGFGTASERINKKVRDDVFESLIRQEVGWFDQQSVGDITSQLSDDTSKIHAFSGEPIRSLVLTLSSLLVGLVVSLFFMWPFALMAMATLPFMAFAAKAKMEMFMGKDEGAYDSTKDDVNSSGGIVIETLSNIRTVASLALEDSRSAAYGQALSRECPTGLWFFVMSQGTAGLGQLVRVWAMGFYFWWGGWLMSKWPNTYGFRDFLIAMFSLLISISGMSVAMQGMTDKDEAIAAADRIFELLERKSEIDPLSEKGLKVAAVNFSYSKQPYEPSSKRASYSNKKSEQQNRRKIPNSKSRKIKGEEATKSLAFREKQSMANLSPANDKPSSMASPASTTKMHRKSLIRAKPRE